MQRPFVDLVQSALVGTRGIWNVLAILAFCLLVGITAGAILALLGPIYTVALIVAVTGAVLVLRDTQWGLAAMVAIICLLPFAAVPLGFGFEPTFLDLALLGIFFVWASRIATRRQGPFIATPLGAPIALFMIILVAALIASLGHSSLTTTLVRRFAELLLGIATFFAVVNCVKTRRQLEQIVILLIIAGLVASLIGIALYVMPEDLAIRLLSTLRVVRYPAGPGVLRHIEDTADMPLRAISTSQDPNVLGGLLILITGLAVPQLVTKSPLLPKKLLLPTIGCLILCLLLTFSRGSMAGLAVGIGAISVLRYRKLAWIILVGAVLLALLPQTQTYVQHFSQGVRGEDLATQMRFGEYSDAIKVIMNYPWLGVGFSGTPEIYLYVGVSNVYLLIAEEAGLIGLALFLVVIALFFIHLWQGAQAARADARLDAILWGIWAAAMGALAAGMLDHYLFNLDFPHAATLFWTYLGLGMVAYRLAKSPDQAYHGLSPMA